MKVTGGCNQNRKGKRAHRRSARGAVTIFLVVVLLVAFMVALPAIAFFANASTLLVVQADSGHIATQAAGVVDDFKYWLGALRPGYDESLAMPVAEAAARQMCLRSGMTLRSINIKSTVDDAGNEQTICEVDVDASRRFVFLPIISVLGLSGALSGNVHAHGETLHSKIPPYALIHMDAPTVDDQSTRLPLGFNQRDVAVIPAFGFFYNAVAGDSNVPPTTYGKGIAPLAPENFRALNHYHLKKEDIENVLTKDEDVLNNAWHPGRLNSGEYSAAAR